jgi:hypothetical protein
MLMHLSLSVVKAIQTTREPNVSYIFFQPATQQPFSLSQPFVKQ